jgi:hypothetical protein
MNISSARCSLPLFAMICALSMLISSTASADHDSRRRTGGGGGSSSQTTVIFAPGLFTTTTTSTAALSISLVWATPMATSSSSSSSSNTFVLCEDDPRLVDYVAHHSVQLEQDIALGGGQAIDDLAAMIQLPAEHKASFGKALRQHKQGLTQALRQDGSDEQRAASFASQLNALFAADALSLRR